MVVIPEAHKTEISISECGEFVLIEQPALDMSSIVWIRISDFEVVFEACRAEIRSNSGSRHADGIGISHCPVATPSV